MVELPGYEAIELVGSGGNAHVYRAIHLDSGDEVAIKVLRAGEDPNVLRRFGREQRLMEELDGIDSVVPILEMGLTPSKDPYLLMPFFSAGSLQAHLEDHEGGLPASEALELAILIGAALARAHELGVLHRDLKPANILLDDDGAPWLADFGIAEFIGSTASMSGAMMTPAFTAPESFLDQKPTIRSDVFGFGALLFTMLTGTPPFGGTEDSSPGAVMNRVLNEPAPLDLLPADLPDSVSEIIGACLEKLPQSRPETIGTVTSWLEDVQSGRRPTISVAPTHNETIASPERKAGRLLTGEVGATLRDEGNGNRAAWLVPIVIALFAVGAVAAGLAFLGGDGEQPATAAADQTPSTTSDPASTTTAAPTTTTTEADSVPDTEPSSTSLSTSTTEVETEVLSEQEEPIETTSSTSTSTSSTEPPLPPRPTAGFTPSTTRADVGDVVRFADSSSGEIDSVEWEFGDGASSNSPSPSHTYTRAGTFTVTQTVTGPGGSRTASATIVVEPGVEPPDAEFESSATNVLVGQTVTFTDRSAGEIESWSWDFGDGTTSTSPTTTHTFGDAGPFPVELTVSGPGGADTSSITITVEHPAPNADFTMSASTVPVGTTVTFFDQSSGNINSREWDYGDGITGTANSHFYGSAGTYTVQLTVRGPGGMSIATRTLQVTVPPPQAIISVRAPNSRTGNEIRVGQFDIVEFDDISSGDIDSSFWTFFGQTDSNSRYSNQYNTPGEYELTLTATGPGGTSVDRVTIVVIGL